MTMTVNSSGTKPCSSKHKLPGARECRRREIYKGAIIQCSRCKQEWELDYVWCWNAEWSKHYPIKRFDRKTLSEGQSGFYLMDVASAVPQAQPTSGQSEADFEG
jgi:hypothetical protein